MIPVLIVYLVDLILVNGLFYAIYALGLGSGATHAWFLYNVCYFIAALTFKPYANRRISHVEQVASCCFYTTLLMFVIYGAYVFIDSPHPHHLQISNFIITAVSCFFLIFFGRCTSRAFLKYLRSAGRNTHSVVYVGAGANLAYLHEIMGKSLSTGYRVVGYFDDRDSQSLPDSVNRLGTISEVIPWINQHHVESIFCNLPSSRADEIVAIINFCENHFIHFYSVPNVRNYVHRALEVDMIGDMPVLTLRRDPLREPYNRMFKRIFDILISGFFLLFFFWWIYIIVAIITKITMPGPVFFRQKRNGLLGEEFYCWKFRSMKVNAQADTLQATKNDPRKTKWGNIMRKTNIDELPQFINVFLGQMSIVGPRPHMIKHTVEYSALIDKYMVRHWVKPGITGWAQVSGARGETEHLWQMEDRIRKDIWYIENWSPWLDIRIMFLTVYNVLGGEKGNAY